MTAPPYTSDDGHIVYGKCYASYVRSISDRDGDPDPYPDIDLLNGSVKFESVFDGSGARPALPLPATPRTKGIVISGDTYEVKNSNLVDKENREGVWLITSVDGIPLTWRATITLTDERNRVVLNASYIVTETVWEVELDGRKVVNLPDLIPNPGALTPVEGSALRAAQQTLDEIRVLKGLIDNTKLGVDASAGDALTYRNQAQGFRNEAETFKNTATTQAGLATTAKTAAETARTGAQTARTGAETARTGAETARTGAETAKADIDVAHNHIHQDVTDAETHALAASQSATSASGSATAAQTAKTGAETARTQAQTARTGAETARTGAETARTGAETARDVAQGHANRAETAANEFDLTATSSTLAPGASAMVTVSGEGPAYSLSLGIPQGEKGDTGPAGAQEIAWTDGGRPYLLDEVEAGAGGSGALTGAGRPDIPSTTGGVIKGNEPVGALFTSTDGAGVGAWVWVKGTSSWTVVNGDTGWRNVTSTLEANGAVSVAGRLRIKRTAGLVWVSADDLQAASGAVVLIPDLQFYMDADNSTYPGALYNLAGDKMQRLDAARLQFTVPSGGCRLRDLRSYPCSRAWPTTLPGTPV